MSMRKLYSFYQTNINLKLNCLHRAEVNEKCPDIVIEYYESRCPINQKCDSNLKFASKYDSDSIDNPPPIRDKIPETVVTETKTTSNDTDATTETVPESSTEELPFLETSEKTADADNDVVNAAFSINVDETNSVQVSYSLPLIENQPGEELMETQIAGEEGGSRDTSNCHMPDLQDVDMQ